jgi:hypothetical protein
MIDQFLLTVVGKECLRTSVTTATSSYFDGIEHWDGDMFDFDLLQRYCYRLLHPNVYETGMYIVV